MHAMVPVRREIRLAIDDIHLKNADKALVCELGARFKLLALCGAAFLSKLPQPWAAGLTFRPASLHRRLVVDVNLWESAADRLHQIGLILRDLRWKRKICMKQFAKEVIVDPSFMFNEHNTLNDLFCLQLLEEFVSQVFTDMLQTKEKSKYVFIKFIIRYWCDARFRTSNIFPIDN